MYEKLYANYIHIEKERNGKNVIPIRCPFPDHNDENPSACICCGSGVITCKKCGSFSPSHSLSKILQIDIDEARNIIKEFIDENEEPVKINIVKSIPRSPRNFIDKHKKSIDIMSENIAVVREYMESRKLKYDTLLDRKIGYLPHSLTGWNRDSVVIPYFYNGNVIALRYRDILGCKSFEEGSNFHLYNIDEVENQEVIVLVEGESDCLRTYQALNKEIVVVGVPSAEFRKEWEREFEDVNQIILVPQVDEAGERLALNAKKVLSEKLVVVELPWQRKQIGNDICDWIEYHSENELAELIKNNISPTHKRIISGLELDEMADDDLPWIIKNFLTERQSAIISGPPKSMKTFFVLNMIKCILEPGSNLCGIPDLESVEYTRNICLVEEEGTLSELKLRAKSVFSETPEWKNRVFFMHQLGVRLDSVAWEIKLQKLIKQYNIGLLILDPFQRMHDADENDATALGVVWGVIDRLLKNFPYLSIILLHHWNKAGDISKGFNSIRGSTRLAGECDLGVFIEKRQRSEAIGIRLKVEGRSIPPLSTEDNKDIFKLAFNNGILQVDSSGVFVNKHESLKAEVDERGRWPVKDAAKHYGVSTQTIHNWAKKAGLKISKPGPNKPSLIECDLED